MKTYNGTTMKAWLGWIAAVLCIVGMLSFAGCPIETDDDFEGMITGSENSKLVADPGTVEPPTIKVSNASILLTWNTILPGKAIAQQVYRKEANSISRDGYLIATIWNEILDTPLSGKLQYTDYFTDSNTEYSYYIIGIYYDETDWAEVRSKMTTPFVKGNTTDDIIFGGNSSVSYDATTGLLSFNPPLPEIPNKLAGTGKTMLDFWNEVTTESQTFEGTSEISVINLYSLRSKFSSFFDYDGIPLKISYDAVYEQIKGGFQIDTFIHHNYTLSGTTKNILIPTSGGTNPVGTISTPTGPAASVQDGIVHLSWNAVSDASGYEIHYADSENGDYYKYPYATSASPSYDDDDVDPGKTWYYKVLAYKNTDTGLIKSDLSNAVPVTVTVSDTVIPLTLEFQHASVNVGNVHYYSFFAEKGTTYSIQWADYDTLKEYTGDIQVSAYYDNGEEIFSKSDKGDESFTAAKTGTITIKAEGYRSGNYAIGYMIKQEITPELSRGTIEVVNSSSSSSLNLVHIKIEIEGDEGIITIFDDNTSLKPGDKKPYPEMEAGKYYKVTVKDSHDYDYVSDWFVLSVNQTITVSCYGYGYGFVNNY
jgi:hypothetical protein